MQTLKQGEDLAATNTCRHNPADDNRDFNLCEKERAKRIRGLLPALQYNFHTRIHCYPAGRKTIHAGGYSWADRGHRHFYRRNRCPCQRCQKIYLRLARFNNTWNITLHPHEQSTTATAKRDRSKRYGNHEVKPDPKIMKSPCLELSKQGLQIFCVIQPWPY